MGEYTRYIINSIIIYRCFILQSYWSVVSSYEINLNIPHLNIIFTSNIPQLNMIFTG